MKKFIKNLFFYTIICSLLVMAFACDGTSGGNTLPEKVGIYVESNTLEFNVGDKLDLFKGITVYDAKGELIDAAKNVTVNHMIPVDAEGELVESNTYNVKYSITLNDEIYTVYRTVKVIFVLPPSEDIIYNGDFETGSVDPFTKTEFDNGAATLSVDTIDNNKLLKVEVSAVSWQQASPRVEYKGITLDPSKYYEISFDAYALEARSIHIQIGELIDADPWYRQCGKGDWYADLGTSLNHYSYRFQPDVSGGATMDKLALLFEFGTMTKGESLVTSCFLDNIKIEEVEDLGIESLLKPETFVSFGGESDAKTNPEQVTVWYVQDANWNCGPVVTLNSAKLDNNVIYVDVNQPEGAFWFATQVFLASKTLNCQFVDVSLNVKSDVAGDITVNGNIFTLAVGDNMISFTAQVIDSQFTLAIQLGAEKAATNLGSAKIEISKILVTEGQTPIVIDYADPARLLGNMAAPIFGAEGDAKKAPETMYYWFVQDANWGCGPIVTLYEAELEKGVLTFAVDQPEGAFWFGSQLFYYTKPIKDAGNHIFTVKIEASKACTVTICNVKRDLVEGMNEISISFDATAGNPWGFTLQLGYLDETLPNQGQAVIGNTKLILSEFAIDGVFAGSNDEPKPIENLFGTPKGVVEGTENDARSNPNNIYLWYVKDASWNCGPVINASYTFENGVFTLNTDQPENANFWSSQLFYLTNPITDPGDYELSFKVNASKACEITICNNIITLLEGENDVKIKVSLNAAEALMVSLQCGTDGPVVGPLSLALSEFDLAKVQPGTDPEPNPQTDDYSVTINSAVGGAWLYMTINWKEEAAAVTKVIPSNIETKSGNIPFANFVGVEEVTANSYRIGAGYAGAGFMDQEATVVITFIAGDKEYNATVTFTSPNASDKDAIIHTVMISYENGGEPKPQGSLFGTPKEIVIEDGEELAKKNPNTFHFWYVKDASWNCGPVIDASYTFENGIFTLNTDQPENANFWSTQLFYKTNPAEVAGEYELSLKINASKACEITICNNTITLLEGENDVKIKVSLNVAEALMFSLQCGTTGPVVGALTLELSDFAVNKVENEPDPNPQTGAYSVIVNSAVGGAWVYMMVSWEDGTEAVTKITSSSLVTPSGEIPFTGLVGVDEVTPNSYKIGAGYAGAGFMDQETNVTLTITAGKKEYDISFIFISPNATDKDGIVKDVTISEGKDVETGEDPNPQTADYQVMVNSAVSGAWIYIIVSWKDTVSAVTGIVPGNIVLESKEVAYTGEVGATEITSTQYKMGAGFASAEFMNTKATISLVVTMADAKTMTITFDFVSVNIGNTDATISNVVIG